MTKPLPMTRGRRLALIIGVPLALALIGWTALSEVAFAGIGSYPVRLDIPVTGHTVTLGVGSASVRVTQAAGDRLRLTGKATYSLVRSSVTWHSTPSGVTVSPQCRFVTGVCGFSFHAVLPADLPASINDGAGNITLQGLSGRVTASDGSGDIGGFGLSGTADFSDGNGDITVGGLTSADVTASDNSGDVTLTFTKVPDRVAVSAGSGDVTLVLPRGTTPYRVNATASSGSRTVRVPTSPASAHAITVTDGSGDISITN
jgi:Putative adhesin